MYVYKRPLGLLVWTIWEGWAGKEDHGSIKGSGEKQLNLGDIQETKSTGLETAWIWEVREQGAREDARGMGVPLFVVPMGEELRSGSLLWDTLGQGPGRSLIWWLQPRALRSFDLCCPALCGFWQAGRRVLEGDWHRKCPPWIHPLLVCLPTENNQQWGVFKRLGGRSSTSAPGRLLGKTRSFSGLQFFQNMPQYLTGPLWISG